MTQSPKTTHLPASNGLKPMWDEPGTPEWNDPAIVNGSIEPRRADETEDEARRRHIASGISYGVAFDAPDPLESAVEMVTDRCWTEAESLGWHASYEKLVSDVHNGKALEDMFPRTEADVQAWIVSKMFLVMGELAEAGEELRNGRSVLDVYYSLEHPDGSVSVFDEQLFIEGIPQYKPEGWLVEMADTLIRVCDLVGVVAGTQGVMFGPIVAAKLQYNATRGVMHGGKKF